MHTVLSMSIKTSTFSYANAINEFSGFNAVSTESSNNHLLIAFLLHLLNNYYLEMTQIQCTTIKKD